MTFDSAQNLRDLRFESFAIDHLVDETGHYALKLDREFPFIVKLFSYESLDPAVRLNWHNRLELFVPVAGHGSFRMGDRVIDFKSGDVLVVDNLKLHGLVRFQGRERRAVIISFKAELFYNLGSPLCDFSYLTPFYSQTDDQLPILSTDDRLSPAAHAALANLLGCYFTSPGDQHFKAGCKAYLGEILYLLARHFGWTEFAKAEYARQLERSERLGALIEYLNRDYGEKITVAKAASMIGMSESRFMKFFKQATGMTFVKYLLHIRLTSAYRLLKDQNLTVAEIASAVGFADQSYFDKKFKQHFERTPRECRAKR